jgi:hypothetical protein
MPQAPQLLSSAFRLTQSDPQQTSGELQSGPMPPQRHRPPAQNSPESQLVAQSPQCSSEVCGS